MNLTNKKKIDEISLISGIILSELLTRISIDGNKFSSKKGFIFIATTHSQILRSIIFSNVKPC